MRNSLRKNIYGKRLLYSEAFLLGFNVNILPLLSRWRSDSTIGGNIVAWEILPAQFARFLPIPECVHPNLSEALRQNGIEQIYNHQAESWYSAQHGENIVIVTGTASGKTLCYNLPVLDTL
jgi:DEAD/DEAH box helicase domain-containing protein